MVTTAGSLQAGFVAASAADAVMQAHFAAPLEATYAAIADMNRRAFDLAYPPE